MLSSLFSVLAQAATSQPDPANMPWWAKLLSQGGILVPLSLVLVVFYVMVFRQKQKQDKEKADLLGNVKKGDEIETIGGLFGTVVSADEKSVTVKVDETANVKLKFNRRAIHRVITADDAKK